MSILIKGLNMPKDDCEAYRELIITNNYIGNGKIQMLAHDSNTNEFIGEVVEVPEPHGRLIDADAIIVNRSDYYTSDDFMEAINMLEDAPTVIKAEGDDVSD